MRTTRPAPANPGAGAVATLLDTGAREINVPDNRTAQRFRCSIFTDVAVTFRHRWASPGSSNLRVANPPVTPPTGVGQATTANQVNIFDAVLLPGRNVFEIVTVSGPAVWEIGSEVLDQSS